MIELAMENPIDLLVSRVFKRSAFAFDQALADEAIGYRQWLVLAQIRETPGISARQIADLLCHDTGALSRIVDLLFERGLIERDRHPDDRRTIRLTITADGMECSRRCRRKVDERRECWRRRLSASEQASLVAGLSKLAVAMDDDR